MNNLKYKITKKLSLLRKCVNFLFAKLNASLFSVNCNSVATNSRSFINVIRY